jgi:hypothetical protein
VKTSLRHQRLISRHGQSGQAMVEAAIGMSLMAFAWVLIYYATYMVNHSSRCAVAARHVAWAKGNDVLVGVDDVRADVFTDNQLRVLLSVSTDQNSDASGKISGNEISQKLLSIFPDVQKADVRFGVDQLDEATSWPFSLMRTKFPFMPESTMPTLLAVTSHCEWDSVSVTWEKPGDIIKNVIDGMFSKEQHTIDE